MARRGAEREPQPGVDAGPLRRVRCAIYTRKSHEEGLEQRFNSLDAQRDAAESYIASQKEQGWAALPERFDDGGYSGGTMDRPALKRLLAEVEAGRVDCIVVYRVDRLSRSLLDFSKLIEILERHKVSFVSVTEQFSTATSTGRLYLHMILAFAQYEREVIGERIRDKVAAAKRRGQHTGGYPPLGYDLDRVEKRLVVNPDEAKLVRHVFRRFLALGSATRLVKELNAAGHRTKAWTSAKGRALGGARWEKPNVYRLLKNRKYIGEVEHQGKFYPGEHDAIVLRPLWDEVQEALAGNHRARGNTGRTETPALLRGIVRCGHCGCAMGPTFSKKAGKTYRYYLCVAASKLGYDECPVRSVAAGEIEAAVVDQLRAVFRAPELVARTYRETRARQQEELERLGETKRDLKARLSARATPDLRDRLDAVDLELRALTAQLVTEEDVREALERLDPIWDELFPAEQARIVRLLLDRVEVHPDRLELKLRANGLHSLVAEVGGAAAREGKGVAS